ncbi:unnamed protein product [Phytophthora fragariaefolia]|uniref:Unnamed protein product n=1 Tax=Phytophthora fragariaefolia TaxID=1490495 RepID=A0A9W7DBM5_9STRA|nr:unnamed protein product [Phytophthora fragariaefolia]
MWRGFDPLARLTRAHIGAGPSTTDAATNTSSKPSRLDTEEQVASREWVKAFFKKNPNWLALRIHPIKKKDSKDDKRYVIGENGALISRKCKKYKRYEYIDWVATMEKIKYMYYDAESQSIDETHGMLEEEKRTRTLMRLEKNKRTGDELEELDVVLKDRRLPNITFGRKITSTTSDDESSRFKMLWIISKNMEMLDSNGLMKSIVPIFKDKCRYDKSSLEQYDWVKDGSVDVFGESNLKHITALKKIDWQSTIRAFLDLVKSRGLELTMVGVNDIEKNIKDYKPYDDDEEREARHGTKTGIDEDMDRNLSIPDSEAKKILYEYYKSLFGNKIVIPFPLKPVVDSKNGVKAHATYYYSVPSKDRYFNIRDKDGNPVSGNAWSNLMKEMRWMDTFLALLSGLEDAHRTATDIEGPATEAEKKMIKNVNDNLKIIREVIFNNADDVKQQSEEVHEERELDKLHDDAERAFLNYGEAQKRHEETKKAVKGNSSKAARSALKAAASAVKATKSVYSTKYKKYSRLAQEIAEEEERERAADEFTKRTRGSGLKGRGLRGAGVAPLEGVVRRGRTYNLNEIQGLATPSAYVYRQLGSKYIRIPDLDAKTLVIVQPNRRKCGPKCQISDSLQGMIRTLVYKQHIDQPTYDKLSVEDKKMFKEILAITHLQYNFHDKLTDKLETLRAEYDKLKGEIELGNDNPSIIKQLKSLRVDMYSNRLIDDKEFKQIITRLL